MSIFFTLLGKIIPLYVSIILGFLSTYLLKCDKETVAKILLFLLSPLIIFTATININLSAATLSLPLFFFIFSSILSFTLLAYFKRVYSDNSANLLAFSTSTGNTGNIGIPLAILFLEPNMVDVFIFTVLASLLYQNSVGYYITAKGNFSAKQSFLKVIKLPVLYAFILGVIFNLCEIKLPEIFINYNEYIKGAYTILGMMIVGMGLEKVRFDSSFDIKFISYAMFIKFVVWPVCILTFIFIDKNYIHFLNDGLYTVMFLFSIVPLAGNTVTVATLLNVKPQIMSVALFISTVISLFYIPLVLYFYMN
ncbi:AEC family transporter [Aliarcobacter cryaerophilus]|uniref:AEC family transporter n=1 Tax=Aliarcobacter cryaerophilus TaxID=28198 RepID=UPI0021B5FDDE|nr:AEC family transporter [Aliarcobacter cryaerophilus]MCT7461923.1 AEC family transporter [Aliarcobacter cryaerophilus]